MKTLILTLLFIILSVVSSNAVEDTLVIKFKNGKLQKIGLKSFKKITFEEFLKATEQETKLNEFNIIGNFPNPFEDLTLIEFELPKSGKAELYIYDNLGRKIQKIEVENCNAGRNQIWWNRINYNNIQVPEGIYYYQIKFENEFKTKKMIVINK